jgi:hypothetical protein
MPGTGTVFAVFLALFVPQHKLGAIEIVQFDAGTVPVQQELTELNVLMDNDTVGVSVQVGHRFGHVQCRSQLVAWRQVVVHFEFSATLQFLLNVGHVRVSFVIDGRHFHVSVGEPFGQDANPAMAVDIVNAGTGRQAFGNVGVDASVFKVVIIDAAAVVMRERERERKR